VRGTKKDAELRQMLPVRQRVITSWAGILAIVQHVVDARANVEKRMVHSY
jgi:hypothetical protein